MTAERINAAADVYVTRDLLDDPLTVDALARVLRDEQRTRAGCCAACADQSRPTRIILHPARWDDVRRDDGAAGPPWRVSVRLEVWHFDGIPVTTDVGNPRSVVDLTYRRLHP